VSKYVLDHHLEGERARLALMSRLLDPMHRRHLESLGVGPGARTLEVGCGNGSISGWLAERVSPGGEAVAARPEAKAFWDGWLAWSRDQGIDYHVCRALAPRLASMGLEAVAGTAETAVYNGGSPWADYWTATIVELRKPLLASGRLDDALIDGFLAHCADPGWWTQTIAFTAVHGRAPGG